MFASGAKPLTESLLFGKALAAQAAYAGASVQGATIAAPAKRGRILTITLAIGAVSADITGATVGLEGRIGAGAWEDVQDQTGAAALIFTSADFANNGAGEVNGVLVGSIDISRYKYDDYRLDLRAIARTSTGTIAIESGTYSISDLREFPAETVDQLYYKAHAQGVGS